MFNPQFQTQPFGFGNQAMPFIPNYQQPQAVLQPQNSTNNVNWVYVNGIEGARNQIVQPNQTAWMMDNNEPQIYVKSVDGMGTATLKAFRLNEINAANKAVDSQPDNLSAYVRKDDLNGIYERIKAIEETIGGLNA